MNEIIIEDKGIEGGDTTGENIIGKLKAVGIIAIVQTGMQQLGIRGYPLKDPGPLKRKEPPFPQESPPPPLLERPRTPPSVHTHFSHQRHTSGRGRS